MKISPITKEQWVKVLKALAYAFVSAFIVAIAASQDFSKAGLTAAAIAGVNGVFVAVKQLFTQA
jgi:4-amino-4-deoxy-L-arabinose transferase-like glycosyltransferase